MSANKSKVLNLLEMRFDYQSARNVMANWRKSANIKEDMDFLNDDHLRGLLAYLKNNAADASRVHDAIESLILSEAHAAPTPAAVVEEIPEVMEAAPAMDEIPEAADAAPAAEEIAEAADAADNADDASAEAADVAENADENAASDSGRKKKKSKK